MASIYVTGPVHIYVSLPTNVVANSSTGAPSALTYPSSIYYLGTGETAPTIQIAPMYEPVMNDIGGVQAPIDYTYQGKVGQASCTLTRWNEAVIAALDSFAAGGGDARGTDGATAIGSAMLFEGGTFCTWFAFPYYTKNYGTTMGMPAGYRALACRLIPWQIAPGTRAKKRLFSIEMDRVYKPADGKFYLFDNVMTNIPAIPPTGPTGLVS